MVTQEKLAQTCAPEISGDGVRGLSEVLPITSAESSTSSEACPWLGSEAGVLGYDSCYPSPLPPAYLLFPLAMSEGM